MIGGPLHEVLTLSQQRALHKAVGIQIDDLIAEISQMHTGDTLDPDNGIAMHLPRQYGARYNLTFAKQFLACLMTVSWKLFDQENHRLSCLAEELALGALIQTAEGVRSWHDDDADFDTFREYAFEDMDFELLFNPRLDGIENDEAIQSKLHMVGLAFPDWFKPWHGRWYVHPYNHRPKMKKYKPIVDEDESDATST